MFKTVLIFLSSPFFLTAAPLDCPIDLGPDQEACEGEIIILNADAGDDGDTYQWFLNGGILTGENANTLQVSQTGVYSVEVNEGSAICTDDIQVNFNESPDASTPTPLEICDTDNDGFGNFNLNSKIAEITQGNLNFDVSFHETITEAETGINALISPYANVIAFIQTIYIRVQNPQTGCFITVEMDLLVNPTPEIPDTISSLQVCDENNDGQEIFDLTVLEAEIYGANSPSEFILSYHESEATAVANEDPIFQPQQYVNLTNPQQLFVRFENAVTGCFGIGFFELSVLEVPVVNQPNDLSIPDPDGDGIAIFDLTVNTPVILGSQDPAEVSTTFFTTQFDAQNNMNAIDTPQAYTNSANPQQIFVRLENLTATCVAFTNFMITVEIVEDADNDGIADINEDLNNNGNLEDDDTDGDDIPNYLDSDDDGDLVETIDEITGIGAGFNATYIFIDTDEDTIENYLDNDDDGDNTLTIDEDYNGNGDPRDDDMNENNIPDFLDGDVSLGVSEVLFTDLQLFPNPASEVVIVRSQFFTSETKFVLYNLQGQEVMVLENASEEKRVTLNVASLQSGMYFLKITSEGGSVTKKVIKK